MSILRDFAQQPLMQALAWALIHFLWQGALLGLLAFAALRMARPERAATRYAIGVVTLAAMLIACAATFAAIARQPVVQSVESSFAPMFAASAVAASTASELVNERRDNGVTQSLIENQAATYRAGLAPLGPNALVLVVFAWAIGVLVLSVRLLGGWLLTRQLARSAVASVSPAIEAAARRIAGRLQLRRAVAIVESGAVAVPTLVGWIKPVVLLPAAALAGLSTEQLHAILAHELAHVRRHDYLVNLLQSMVETLLFYHPAMWWVSSQVRTEREHCCDDVAIEVCGDRLVYVSALAELTSIAGQRRLALAATDGSLVSRVQRILGRPRAMHEPTPAWALIALFVLIIGGAGSFRTATAATEEAVIPKAKPTEPAPARPKHPITTIASPKLPQHANTTTAHALPKTLAATETLSESTPFFDVQWIWDWFEPAPLAPVAAVASVDPVELVAPVAPVAPAQESGSRSSGNMTWSDNGEKVSVKWNGGFRLSEDEKDIAWVEDGATVSISDGVQAAARVELRGRNGTVERTFTRNGSRREWEPEGRAFLAAAIDKLIRHSAAFAKERVARFLEQGGPEAVLTEIARLGDSSYVRRVYYSELARQAELSESLLGRILQRVPAELRSDYDKATLLTTIVKQPAITDAHRALIARAVTSIGSDYDQRRTLTAVMDTRPVSPAVAAAVLEGAATIGANYDRSLVLSELAGRGGLTPATSAAFMSLVKSMGSSYDQRRVLTAVAAQGSLPDAVAADAIKSAGAISGSYDQAQTLIQLIDRGGVTDASADSFFEAAARISSSHDLSRVLQRAVDRPSMSERVLEGVLRSAAKISSHHERANLLEAVAGRARVTGASRDLFLAATKGMSQHDENRALASLVKAEGRR